MYACTEASESMSRCRFGYRKGVSLQSSKLTTVVTARGTTESQTDPVGSRVWKAGVMKAIPDATVYEAVYPASFATVATTGPKVAARDMLNHIKSRAKSCPSTRFILFGYSQGAMAIVTLLNEAELPEKPIVAIVLYGNPYWTTAVTSSSMNGGTAKSGRGTFGGQQTVPVKFQARTKDYCNANDLFCTGGRSMAVHLSYPISPQAKMSIDFAISQYRAAAQKT